ncbi:plasma-membrane choline transporter-domain-containing protein [Fimicolochytrium jonesii]|uniref:plasma-membrane choline transporter-domain-containing protein n=1 Tax=Fimicolochytrium jonesii TaxID=1396493 RepID=UPI0022FF4188|nr:plasma-membrane choline transporter-domain-containing protein [Fimicolochytrium jonesii]KAI8824963.1 plasma-membrane choline transporter-domain-containing protein [Fimicolochytrium jonesii]
MSEHSIDLSPESSSPINYSDSANLLGQSTYSQPIPSPAYETAPRNTQEETKKNEPFPSPVPSDRFAFVNTYRDFRVGIVFVAQLFIATVINIVGIANLKSSIRRIADQIPSGNGLFGRDGGDEGVHPAFYVLPLSLIGSILLAILALRCLRLSARKTTYVALYVPIVGFSLLAIGLLTSSFAAAAMSLGVAAIFGYMIRRWERRVAFTIVMVETVTEVMDARTSMYAASSIALVVHALYALAAGAGWIGFLVYQVDTIEVSQDPTNPNRMYLDAVNFKSGTGFGLVYLIFSAYWTLQFIPMALQTVLAGAFASHYFSGKTAVSPLKASFVRTFTTSFGSVAFGSFVVLIAQFISSIFANVGHGSLVGACCQCGLGMFLSLLKCFNKYAFARVAIYGQSYVDAARDTWELFKSSGINIVINDSLISWTMGCLAVGVALASAMGAYGVSMAALPSYRSYPSCDDFPEQDYESQPLCGSNPIMAEAVAIAYCAFIAGVVVMQVVYRVVDAGVSATFVAIAEDSKIMKTSYPKLYETFEAIYPTVVAQWSSV